jgi:hypothetical protein
LVVLRARFSIVRLLWIVSPTGLRVPRDGVFEAWAIYRDGQEERMQRGSGNEWADVLMHTGPFASQ